MPAPMIAFLLIIMYILTCFLVESAKGGRQYEDLLDKTVEDSKAMVWRHHLLKAEQDH